MRLGRRFGADLEEGGWRWFRENGTPTMAITAIATGTTLRLRLSSSLSSTLTPTPPLSKSTPLIPIPKP